MLHHGFCPFYHFVFQSVERHYLIDQSHFEGFLSRILTAEEPDFTGLFLSDDACQIRRTESGVKASHTRTGLSEDGIFGSDGQVADYVEHVTATDGISVDHGNDGLGDGAYLLLYIQYVQAGYSVGTYITAMSFDVHVSS